MSIEVPSHKTKAEKQQKTTQPPLFKVLMHNDDYSTMEFVVEMLQTVFRKTVTEAEQIMLTIHYRGFGVCGTYPHAIAESKVDRVHTLARNAGFPLRCSIEEA